MALTVVPGFQSSWSARRKGARRKANGVVPAQHSDDPLMDDGQSDRAGAIHILQGGPQLGVWTDTCHLIERPHDGRAITRAKGSQ